MCGCQDEIIIYVSAGHLTCMSAHNTYVHICYSEYTKLDCRCRRTLTILCTVTETTEC